MIKIFKTKQMYNLRTSLYFVDIERENVFILDEAGSLDFLFYVKNCRLGKKRNVIEENIVEIKKDEQEEVYNLFSKLYFDMFIKYKEAQKERDRLFFVGKEGGRDWRKFKDGNKFVLCHDEFTNEGIQEGKIRNYTTICVDEEKVTITTIADSHMNNNSVEINTSRGYYIKLLGPIVDFWKSMLTLDCVKETEYGLGCLRCIDEYKTKKDERVL